MKILVTTSAVLVALVTQAAAGAPAPAPNVPEMDAGAGIAAIALLVGAVAIMREKFTRK